MIISGYAKYTGVCFKSNCKHLACTRRVKQVKGGGEMVHCFLGRKQAKVFAVDGVQGVTADDKSHSEQGTPSATSKDQGGSASHAAQRLSSGSPLETVGFSLMFMTNGLSAEYLAQGWQSTEVSGQWWL